MADLMDWRGKPMRLEQDEPGADGLFIVLDGYTHDEDHIVRIYGPSDEDEAREFLQAVAEMWNDTSRRMMADSSQQGR